MAGQPAPIDSSFAYKDAAIAILTYEKAVLVTDDSSRKAAHRRADRLVATRLRPSLGDAAQMFGMEQMMRSIGPPRSNPYRR